MVFCLMEAPDKESCAAIMGNEGKVNEYDIVETQEGSLDNAYRMIMVVDIISIKLYDELFTRISQKAFKLIKNKQGNISEIAFESGFSSPSYFTRSFQKRFYMPPAQLLKHD